jgi:simple sugar transport system substrate-binding protein
MKLGLWTAASAAVVLAMGTTGAFAQSGSVGQAVAGYSFDDAAQEAPGTKVAGNMIGANILLLGSESPTDDPAREIEILNQIINDPTLDGLIMTTPQVGAYDDIVRTAEANGIPIATTNSFDGGILNRNAISHTGQDASAAAIAGEALVQCLVDRGITSGSIILPSDTAMGNIEVNNRVSSAYNAIVASLEKNGTLANFQVDAGPENVGVAADMNDPANSIISLIESRGDVVGAFAGNNVFTPALASAVEQTGNTGKMCAYGFDLGPAQQEALAAGNLTGALGQQPFLQGFWPVMQLYLQIDRGISAANLDTRAQLVTQETVGNVGKRFEN